MKVVLCLLLSLGLGLIIYGTSRVYADCPECYSDYKPLEGKASAGRPATINGRPAISVRLDDS